METYSWEFETSAGETTHVVPRANRCVIYRSPRRLIAWAIDAETAQRIVDALNATVKP